MSIITVNVDAAEKPRAEVIPSTSGMFIAFRFGNNSVYVPGYDAEAIEQARTWAAQLLNAAETIADRRAALAKIAPQEVA